MAKEPITGSRLVKIENDAAELLKLVNDIRSRVSYLEGYIAGRADAGNPVVAVTDDKETF